MTRLVALFRGINVGGHNKVPMAPLRELFGSLGFTGVSSIIQSGNVCFDSDAPADEIVETIRAGVHEQFAVDVPVLLRTEAEMSAALAAHPFPIGALAPKFHHIVFLAEPAPVDAAERIGDHPPDEYEIIGSEIHIRYPDGSGRSTLGPALDRAMTIVGTSRNLPTCEKIVAALRR